MTVLFAVVALVFLAWGLHDRAADRFCEEFGLQRWTYNLIFMGLWLLAVVLWGGVLIS